MKQKHQSYWIKTIEIFSIFEVFRNEILNFYNGSKSQLLQHITNKKYGPTVLK